MICASASVFFGGGAMSFFDHKVKNIDDKPVEMGAYKGRVVMVVNTASQCGLTPQYEALERAYREFKPKGFVVIGFPANNFRGQEPGTNKEIKQFCVENYKVTFPMMAKVSVGGKDQAPIYEWLVAQSPEPEVQVRWNFEKFLIDRKGDVRYRFDPRTRPDDPKVRAALATLLAEPR